MTNIILECCHGGMCGIHLADLVDAHKRGQTFATARVNQGKRICCPMLHVASLQTELAKEGVPLPFGNRFWASNWPTGKSPLPGLIIHLIPSVSTWLSVRIMLTKLRVQVIVILGPPMNVAYPFILDVEGYPSQIINLFIVIVCRPPSLRIPSPCMKTLA